MKKYHILFLLLDSGFIAFVILFKTFLWGGKHLSPYLFFAVLLFLSLILVATSKHRRKIIQISSFYLLCYIISVFLLFQIFHWPNHDREYIRVPDGYSSYPWMVDKPALEDFDTLMLSELLKKADQINNLRSVIIVKDKKLVVERYFHGCTVDDAFNMFSMTQAIMSSLTGIAVDKGIINSVNDTVIGYFPKYRSKAFVNDKTDLTINHLLTNTAGLSGNKYESSFKSLNWIRSTLKRPKQQETGKHYFQQQTGHLLSGIITNSSRKSTKEFAEEYLCKPLGIRITDWFRSPEGIYQGNNALYLTSRDLARFGDLYLSQGELDGKQIISEAWIKEATHTHVKTNYTLNDNFIISGVGYSWLTAKIHDYEVLFTSDLVGQYIINIPAVNVTIVTTVFKMHDHELMKELISDIISTFKS